MVTTVWTKQSKSIDKWYRDKTVETSVPAYNDSSITYNNASVFYSGRDTSIPIDGPNATDWDPTGKNTTSFTEQSAPAVTNWNKQSKNTTPWV